MGIKRSILLILLILIIIAAFLSVAAILSKSEHTSDTDQKGSDRETVMGDITERETDGVTCAETEDTTKISEGWIIDAPYISQCPNYPNGCESVTAVMVLRYFGIDITVDGFIDEFLDMGDTPVVGDRGPDPDLVYCGDPRSEYGWGCNSPVIIRAVEKIVDNTEYRIDHFYGKSLDELCSIYIDNDIPVIVWATVGMEDSSDESFYACWTTESGKQISYNRRLHCLLLVGYDGNFYYFNDPMSNNADGKNIRPMKKALLKMRTRFLAGSALRSCRAVSEGRRHNRSCYQIPDENQKKFCGRSGGSFFKSSLRLYIPSIFFQAPPYRQAARGAGEARVSRFRESRRQP